MDMIFLGISLLGNFLLTGLTVRFYMKTNHGNCVPKSGYEALETLAHEEVEKRDLLIQTLRWQIEETEIEHEDNLLNLEKYYLGRIEKIQNKRVKNNGR